MGANPAGDCAAENGRGRDDHRRICNRYSRHFAEIVAYFEHPYTNAVPEGFNSVIQNVKRRARGFRNMDYFATMIYLTCGKLDLKAVTTV